MWIPRQNLQNIFKIYEYCYPWIINVCFAINLTFNFILLYYWDHYGDSKYWLISEILVISNTIICSNRNASKVYGLSRRNQESHALAMFLLKRKNLWTLHNFLGAVELSLTLYFLIHLLNKLGYIKLWISVLSSVNWELWFSKFL